MSMELKGKMKGCMSENVMFLQWRELRKGELSYQAFCVEYLFNTGHINYSNGQDHLNSQHLQPELQNVE